MTIVMIDGAYGEGGGQILRTALGLSLVTGTAFCIDNIRAGRAKPGLLRQHLTAVLAATEIAQAEVSGAVLGSRHVTFRPHQVRPGAYTFSVGTAGSTTLVLQTILPALLRATVPSTLMLEGGTHNPYAPPFDFLVQAFLPLLQRLGAKVEATLERPGFYPAGGGKCQVQITPGTTWSPLELRMRGAIQDMQARAVVANLPRHIAERELAVLGRKLSWQGDWLQVESLHASSGPGNIVTLTITSAHVTEVCTGFGERGVAAEAVAQQVVQAARRYLATDVAVGEHLADQLLVPLAVTGGGTFTTLPPSSHTTTNIYVIERFLGHVVTAVPHSKDIWELTVRP